MAAAIAVGTAGLAGCTGSGEPDEGSASRGVTTAPVTAGAVPNPRPSSTGPTAPARPAEIDQMTPAGAAAAARYFIELYGYVLQTGDLTEWDAMSFPTCRYCVETRRYITSAHSSGETFTGSVISTEVVNIHELNELVGGYPVDLRVTQGPTTHLDASGSTIESGDTWTEVMRFETVFDGESWTILDAAVLDGVS